MGGRDRNVCTISQGGIEPPYPVHCRRVNANYRRLDDDPVPTGAVDPAAGRRWVRTWGRVDQKVPIVYVSDGPKLSEHLLWHLRCAWITAMACGEQVQAEVFGQLGVGMSTKKQTHKILISFAKNVLDHLLLGGVKGRVILYNCTQEEGLPGLVPDGCRISDHTDGHALG